MQVDPSKRGVLLKTGITRDILLNDFISGMSLVEIARRHGRSGSRIWQILRNGCTEAQFEEYKRLQRTNREHSRFNKFMELADKLCRIPSLKEARENIPGIQEYYYNFKSVLLKKGYIFTTNHIKRGRRRTSCEEELIHHLKHLAEKLNHTPSCADINQDGRFTHNMYVSAFGSMNKAQEMAGLKPNKKYNSVENARRVNGYISRDHCLQDIRRIHNEFEGRISLAALREHGKYTVSQYFHRLGGIKKIKELMNSKKP